MRQMLAPNCAQRLHDKRRFARKVAKQSICGMLENNRSTLKRIFAVRPITQVRPIGRDLSGKTELIERRVAVCPDCPSAIYTFSTFSILIIAPNIAE